MEKGFSKEFMHCPNCHSTQRFFEQLGKELVESGHARPNFKMCMDARQGVAADPTIQAILIGSIVPGFLIHTDICISCGAIYATLIARLEGKTVIVPKDGRN